MAHEASDGAYSGHGNGGIEQDLIDPDDGAL